MGQICMHFTALGGSDLGAIQQRDLNIPADAEFLGYGVHLEESDEFLSEFREQDSVTSKMWVAVAQN